MNLAKVNPGVALVKNGVSIRPNKNYIGTCHPVGRTDSRLAARQWRTAKQTNKQISMLTAIAAWETHVAVRRGFVRVEFEYH